MKYTVAEVKLDYERIPLNDIINKITESYLNPANTIIHILDNSEYLTITDNTSLCNDDIKEIYTVAYNTHESLSVLQEEVGTNLKSFRKEGNIVYIDMDENEYTVILHQEDDDREDEVERRII